MTALRFAARVAFSRDRRHLWRQVSVLGASFVAALAILASISVLSAVSSAYERSVHRAPDLLPPVVTGDLAVDENAPPPDGAKLRLVERGTVVDGQQVPTIWIEPLPGYESDPSIIPVGLDSLPAPGEAVLSPGLAAHGHTAEDFGWSASQAGSGSEGTIGPQGLMTASEPLIFVRPADGRTLDVGTTPQYAQSFGQQPRIDFETGEAVSDSVDPYALDPELLPHSLTLQGAIGFLLVPALVLLISSSRARSALRDQRLDFMVKIGIRERVARAVLASETGMLAITGSLLGSLIYTLASPFVAHIPTTSITLLPGELTAPWWGPVLTVLSVGSVAAACGALGRIQSRQGRSRTPRPRLIFVAGLALALTCVLISALSPTVLASFTKSPAQAQGLLFGGGTLAALLMLPLAVPGVTWLVAGRLANSRQPAVWVAARRIRADAVRLSRIASVVGLLILTASVATSAWAASRATQTGEQPTAESTHVLQASWRAPERDDLLQAREALTTEGVDALVLATQAEDDSNGPTPNTVIIEDCRSFVDYFAADASALCSEEARSSFDRFVSDRTGHAPADSTTSADKHFIDVLIVSRTPIDHEAVQKAWGKYPGLNVEARATDMTAPLPLQQWIIVGGLTALTILGLAAVREVGDRAVSDAERDRTYLRIGIAAPAVDLLAWIVMLFPLLTGMTVAFAASVIIAYSGELLSITRGNLLQLTVISSATILLAALVIAITVPVRRAMRPSS